VTPTAALLVSFTAVVAVVDWAAVAREVRRAEYVAKPAVMVLLVAVALAVDPVDPAFRWAIVVGLVCSLAGDVFLMLPRESLFLPGLASFFVAHLAYLLGFGLRGLSSGWIVAGLVVVAVGVATVGVRVVRAVQAGEQPALAGPVAAYLGVISAMVVAAFATRNVFAAGGAVLFYASDAVLAWNRFVRPVDHGRVITMVTYHLGQLGIVLSLV
jgi:uncharacterized membrane protein YhhN